jgi:hypothetical protein
MKTTRIISTVFFCSMFVLLSSVSSKTDASGPAVTLVSPADDSVVNSTTVSFTSSATDAVGLVEATLYIGNQPQTATFSGSAETDDAQISADSPNANYAGATEINVDGLSPHAHAVIKFPNIFGSGPGQVPAGASFVKATLDVNCLNVGNAMRLYRLIEDWVEADATWNNRAAGFAWTNPGADGSGSHAATPLDGNCSSTGWRTFDITPFLQDWSNGSPNCGIVMKDTGTDGVDFYTSESATPPVLNVTYQTQWQPGETKPLSGRSDTATFTTTLSDQQSYVWNCLVTNTSSEQSWAPADFHLTVDTGYPNQPVLVSPPDRAADLPTSPTLEVTVSDPQGDSLDVTFYGRQASAASDFTIVPLPDTQKYCLSYPDIFTAQTQWVVNNAASRNIAFVTQEGDIVDTYNSTLEWDRANASISLLDGIVAYGLAPGNHDQPTTLFNYYFPYTRYESQPWYGDHRGTTNDTNYELFSAGGDDYIVMQLEYWPSSDVITWADSVLKTHANRKAIITTHGFLGTNGDHYVHGMGSTQYIWDGLVVPNDNVYFVLCGHEAGEYKRTDVVNGREVHQLLADYQGRANGGDGWLRTMRFAPSEDRVYVETYSPWLNQYETDSDSQFALNFPMGGFTFIGTDTGVPSVSDASVIWSNLSVNTQYEWYATVTDTTGRTQTGPAWHFTTTANDTTPPVISDVNAVDLTESTARIVWTTDEPADSLVACGLDKSYGLQASDAALVTSHSITLSGLTPQITYHYCVTSKHGSEHSATSADYTFTTLAPNGPPVANDDTAITDQGTAVTVAVLGNDSDPDGDALTVSSVTQGANGSVVINLGQTVTYTPNAGFYGTDTFTYTASDGKGGMDTATVTVTVERKTVHVASIDMSLGVSGKNRTATAVVTIVNHHGNPVSGAKMSGKWSGAVSKNVQGTTNGSGKVTFKSPSTSAKTGTITFTVTNVTASGYAYDPSLNAETSDSVSW